MSGKVHVGNLDSNANDDDLREAFSDYGHVLDVTIMRDHETGRSRGFGFITYGTDSEAVTAIQELNEQEFHGKRIRVNFANAQSAGGFRHDNHGSYG
ncbi:hypothetical protein CPB85DRAFT_1439522 [Mucidula mucida]|nr:hypothetical protein CPB85DRAFT_1439522 [Mucidula mucida]